MCTPAFSKCANSSQNVQNLFPNVQKLPIFLNPKAEALNPKPPPDPQNLISRTSEPHFENFRTSPPELQNFTSRVSELQNFISRTSELHFQNFRTSEPHLQNFRTSPRELLNFTSNPSALRPRV